MKIIFLQGINSGTAAEYDLAEVTVGWDKDNTVSLDAVGVSRHHAAIIRKPEGNWVICDLHSTNGVKVNGNAVEGEAPLFDGDLVTIAEQEFRIEKLEAGRDKVDLQPISKSEETPPVAAAKAGEDLLQQLRSAGNALFERTVSAQKEPEKRAKTEDSRTTRRKQWIRRSIVLCILIGAVALFLPKFKPVPPPKNKEVAVKAVDLTFYYERVNYDAARKKAYRLEVQLENGVFNCTRDDLYSGLRFHPDARKVAAEDVEQFAAALKDPELTALTSNSAAVPSDCCDYCRLVIISGGEVIDLKYPGDGIPVAFNNAEAKILDFMYKFNYGVLFHTREEMEKSGDEHLAQAKEAAADFSDGNLSKLQDAIRAYSAAIQCYQWFEPRPRNWEIAQKGHSQVVELQQKKLRELQELCGYYCRLGKELELERTCKQIQSLMGDNAGAYVSARKQLKQLRSKNKQRGKR